MVNIDLKEELKRGKKKLGVWGLGYIGFSSITHFAREGVLCIGHDLSERRVNDVNEGIATIPNLSFWLGFNTKILAKEGQMSATLDWHELINEDVAVHLITIPTEKKGKPYHEILEDVITKLSNFKDINLKDPPLIIIESTLTPTAVDKIVIPLFEKKGLKVGKDILLGVAPRRDWFTSADKSLTKLPRVVGGTTQETTDLMVNVLSIICENIIPTKDHKHSAIVKSIENAYRQLDITLANQLSLAYPDLDMKGILKMVGTKWNVGTFHPSFGTGGYCIPLAPQYVLEGAKYPEKLTLLKESLKTDFSQPNVVVDSILRKGAKKVAILGLAYTGDLKVETLSPSISISKSLKAKGCNVYVNDPYFNEEEIKEITGCEILDFPKGLFDVDTILVVSPHMNYKKIHEEDLINHFKNIKLIIDNMGVWNNIKFPDFIEYHEAGDANWLE